MATKIRKANPSHRQVVDAFNALKLYVMTQVRAANTDLVSIAADSVAFATPAVTDPGPHNDRSEVLVTAADGDATLATALLLINNIIAVYRFHMADTLTHKVAGVALASYVPATTLAGAYLLANDVKSKYGTHRASTTYHYVADGTNTISAADATTQGSLDTLCNELKADINAHMVFGPTLASIRLS